MVLAIQTLVSLRAFAHVRDLQEVQLCDDTHSAICRLIGRHTLKKAPCHKWDSSFRGSLHLCRYPPFFRPKSARWLDNLPSKSPPTADLHHADVIAHTAPITATSSLNCTQYPTESKCNGFLLRHLDPTPKITIYYFVSELTWASIKINIIPPPYILSINIVSICYM